jgi:hypothetical protein
MLTIRAFNDLTCFYAGLTLLCGELDAAIERLVAKGRAVPGGKHQLRSGEVHSQPTTACP